MDGGRSSSDSRAGGAGDSAEGEGAERTVTELRAQLQEALADMENIRAVAMVSESTKQEAIDQVKRYCQEELDSLQAILKESIGNYDAQLQSMEKERSQWRQYQESKERELAKLRSQVSGNHPHDNLENDMKKAQEDAERLCSIVIPMEQEIAALKQRLMRAEEQLSGDGLDGSPPQHGDPSPGRTRPPRTGPQAGEAAETFADNWFAGSAAEAEASPRPVPGQEDTVSLISTGTLVPESIYLPPPGYQLLPEQEWQQLQQEVNEYQDSLQQTREQLEKATVVRQGLEQALKCSTEDCNKEVSLLKQQVEVSAREVDNVQEMFVEAQEKIQKQMVELMETHKELHQRLRHLQGDNESVRGRPGPPSQGEHSDWSTSTQLLTRLQEKTAEVDRLQALCSQQRQQLQAETEEKADLTLRLREEKGKGQRLQAELDTSEQVQRDFVQLSQALQVRLEQIRQADSLERVRAILESVTKLRDVNELGGAWDQES